MTAVQVVALRGQRRSRPPVPQLRGEASSARREDGPCTPARRARRRPLQTPLGSHCPPRAGPAVPSPSPFSRSPLNSEGKERRAAVLWAGPAGARPPGPPARGPSARGGVSPRPPRGRTLLRLLLAPSARPVQDPPPRYLTPSHVNPPPPAQALGVWCLVSWPSLRKLPVSGFSLNPLSPMLHLIDFSSTDPHSATWP